LKTQGGNNNSDIPSCDHQIKLQHKSRERIQRIYGKNREDFQIYHIPTLLNGEIVNKSMKSLSSVVTSKDSVTRNMPRQHKVTMVGDTFLRGIRENVELSLSNEFSMYSMVKPGCELNTLLESATSASGSLTQKDVIFICSGSNDLKIDKDESVIYHIRNFIKTTNHTNIVVANVPVRYDLSYYSQVNKGRRSYNKKLMEITKEHKQVALIEIDINRKYHTQHGLHFNKLGKLLFSNKITQAIYSILRKKLKQSSVMSGKHKSQGDEREVDGRNSNQGNKDFRNNEDIIKLIQTDVERNSEERLNQDEDETTSESSDDKNLEGKFSQNNNNKVVVSHEPECVNEEKGCNKDRNSEERLNQDEDETTCETSNDKNLEGKFSQNNNKVVLSQELECVDEEKGGNKDKTVILE